MKRGLHLALTFAFLVNVIACDGPPTRPSRLSSTPAPSPTPTPPAPAVAGEIKLTSITPGSGATLPIWDCDPTMGIPFRSGLRPSHIIGLCTDQLLATFEVVVDQDLEDARLMVSFVDGQTMCGVAYLGGGPVRAGVPATFSGLWVQLSDDPILPSGCWLPVTTTRMVVEFVGYDSQRRVRGLLRQEFVGTYTFAAQ